MISEHLALALLLPAGILAGIVNVLAGGGSFLTLPLLLAAGLPVPVANGTNRIAVVLQAVVATREVVRNRAFDRKLCQRLLPMLLPGAVLGALLATQIDPARLRTTFGVLFVVMGVVVLVRSRLNAWLGDTRGGGPLRQVALFAIGVYGGFIQAGVGLWLLLGITSMYGVDALRANGVKLPLVLIFTVPALVIFLMADQVRWLPGLVLALGTVIGSIIGVRVSLARGPELIWRAVTIVLFLTGAHLLWPGT